MAHVTQQVRNYFTDTLKAAGFVLPDSRGRILPVNVFESRVYKLTIADLPALAIYSRDEEIETRLDRQCAKRPQIRTIQTSVVCVVASEQKRDDLVDNRLDALSLLVENKIFEDNTLGGIAHYTNLVNKTRIMSEETDRPYGLLDLLFTSRVLTLEGDAESGLQN
jgi:hypothetical protein